MWSKQDFAYNVSENERVAFKSLNSDRERENFIEQFWQRHDPQPFDPDIEPDLEHERRIEYASQHYWAVIPGCKTDRGRIYIEYGPPDEIESHPASGTSKQEPEYGGREAVTHACERWVYQHIEGVGRNVVVEFVDPDGTGEYRMTPGPVANVKQN